MIGAELAEISSRHDGRPLALLDYEDVVRGLRNHRIVFSRWWEEQTGKAVLELTSDGKKLHYSQLPRQVHPNVLKPEEDDPRFTVDKPLTWPLSPGCRVGAVRQRVANMTREEKDSE